MVGVGVIFCLVGGGLTDESGLRLGWSGDDTGGGGLCRSPSLTFRPPGSQEIPMGPAMVRV